MYGMNSFKINLEDLDETSNKLGYYFALPIVKENHQLGVCVQGDKQEIEVIKLESNAPNYYKLRSPKRYELKIDLLLVSTTKRNRCKCFIKIAN